MLDFILALEKFLPQWPENTKVSLTQLSQSTNTAMPKLIDCLSMALDRTLDVHEPLSYKEADRAYQALKCRMANELEQRQRQRLEDSG